MWLNLWNQHQFVKKEAWQKLDALCGGSAEYIADKDADFIASLMNSAYSARNIPKIEFINTLPQKKNPKFSEIINWGNHDE